MPITWIKKGEITGSATFTNSYIVINKSFADRFTDAYSVLVGIDDKQNVILKPLRLDEAETPLYKDALLLKVNIMNTYVRLGNTANMKTIGELLNEEFSKTGIKYQTLWNEKENALEVLRKGEN